MRYGILCTIGKVYTFRSKARRHSGTEDTPTLQLAYLTAFPSARMY